MIVRSQIILYFCLALLSATLSAQDHRFYGPERLGSTLITAIGQGADGFLWVGSEQGVARFDGYRFAARTSLDGTLRPTVTASLYCDADGRVWVGAAHGLYAYDGSRPQGENFRSVLFPDSLLPRVQSMLETADGRLLAGTAGYGLFEIDRTTFTASRATDFASDADNAYFFHLFRSADGTVWKAGTDGRIVARRRNGQLQTYAPERGTPVGFFQRGAETYALCHDGVQALSASAQYLTTPALASYFICCTMDAEGNIFAGTRGDGLFWLPRGEQAFRRMSVSVSGLDLDRARVETLFTDSQGNLWVGCNGRGLLVLALRHHSPFQTWSFAEQRRATGTYVSAIAEGSGDVAYWCCVQGDGVYGFDAVGRITANPAAPAGVETLMRDSEGTYWLGTSDELWRYDPATGAARHIATLPGERVADIVELDATHLAVSTFAAGIAIVDKTGQQPVRQLSMHATDTLRRGRLANDWVYALDVDARGRLWIGTASGICLYDPATDSFASEGWRILADRETCTALHVLTSGDVLMATSRGLLRWSRANGLHTEAGTEALNGRSIAFIAEDRQGDIWLSTNDGIWRWQPREAILSAQTRIAAEYVQGVGLQAADGCLLFGQADGLTKFNPDALRHQPAIDAQVHFTAATHTDANWHIEFSLMDFISADATVFEYRFDDDDDDTWQQLPPGENAVTFSRLAPGDYRLLVRASIAGQTTKPSAYSFEVPPPWWQSGWAYLAYFLIIASAAAFVALLYRRHIQHQLDREKLGFLISATSDEATPLTLDELQSAIARYVQSRRQQHGQIMAQAKNVAAMTDDIEQPEVSGNDELLMQRITKSVNRHLGDSEFTVEQMCEEVGISRAHLHRKMKELTGFSVTEFVRNIRLEQAARLLREQKLNITQVAYTVGFSNLGYFSTVFRKHFGLSPRDFVAQAEAAQ